MNINIDCDFLVVGSGIAGLMTALHLAKDEQNSVVLISKGELKENNSYYAQGGIAAVDAQRVAQSQDKYAYHVEDTCKAGDGLCDKKVVSKCIKGFYKSAIESLLELGVNFSSQDDDGFILHQEGGHSSERIYCVDDHTGRNVIQTLVQRVKDAKNIRCLEHNMAINLITQNYLLTSTNFEDKCLGAYVLDVKTSKVRTIRSKKTILATGGVGKVFKYTSNPEVATGDGIAMAYRVGARIANMEFVQFHPTVLYQPEIEVKERRFLITEALRGENLGGILTLTRESCKDFVLEFDDRGSHATRDIVSRAIDTKIKELGLQHVWLNLSQDVTGKDKQFFQKHYPNIYKKCAENGYFLEKDPIPVVPAAHYVCGGVMVDDNALSDVSNLYVVGESAYTGLMGANRLASNSLPEGCFYAMRAAKHAIKSKNIDVSELEIPDWQTVGDEKKLDKATMNQFWDITREVMTNLCGIERNNQRLYLVAKTTDSLALAAHDIYKKFPASLQTLELRNLTLVARMIAFCALSRKESRGCHYREDYPQKDEKFRMPTVIKKDIFPRI